jgi:hypothetical protein
VEEVVGKEKE